MSEEAPLTNPVADDSAVLVSDAPAAAPSAAEPAPVVAEPTPVAAPAPVAAAAAPAPAAAPEAAAAAPAAVEESKEPLAAVPLASAAAAVEAVAAVVPAVPITINMPNIKLSPYEFSFNTPFTMRVLEYKVVEPAGGGGKPIVFYRVAHFSGATYPEWIPPVVPEPIWLDDGTPHFEDVELWPAPETPEKPELATAVDWRWKRYSEFEMIYNKLHTYPGAIRLPHIPPKTYNPFQSPADALLLATRMQELDKYIYALSAWLSLPNTNGFTKMHLDKWLRTDVGIEAEARFEEMVGKAGQEKVVPLVEVPEKDDDDHVAALQAAACDAVDAVADATGEIVADASAQVAGGVTTAVAGKAAGAAAKKAVKKTVNTATKEAKNAVMPQQQSQSAGASGQATGSSGAYPGPSRAAVAPAPAPVPVKVLTVAEKLEIAAKAKADAQAANDTFLESLSSDEKEKHLAQVELIKRLKSFEGFAFFNSYTGFCEHWRFEVAFSTTTRQFAARVTRRVMCSSAPGAQRSKTTFECLVSVDTKDRYAEMELRAPGAPSVNNKAYYVRIHVPESVAQARTVDPNANSLEDGPALAVSSPVTPETPASPSAGKRSIKIDFTDEYFFLGLRGNSLPLRPLTSYEEEQAEMQRQLTEGTGVYTRKLVETNPPAAIALM